MSGQEWIPYDGSGMPVAPDVYIKVELRCGERSGDAAGTYRWSHKKIWDDIIAYRVAKESAEQQVVPPGSAGEIVDAHAASTGALAVSAPPVPCCGYVPKGGVYPVYWNPYNGVVQCHNCGQVWKPAPPATEPIGNGHPHSCVCMLCKVAEPAPKWCHHCNSDTHNDAECWSTRMVPAPSGETPETDAITESLWTRCLPEPWHWKGLGDHARNLERQRNALQLELAATKRENESLHASLQRLTGMKFSDRMHAALVSRVETAERALTDLQKKFDGAAAELPNILPDRVCNTGDAWSEGAVNALRTAATSIIAKHKSSAGEWKTKHDAVVQVGQKIVAEKDAIIARQKADTDRLNWLEAIAGGFHNIDRISSVKGKFNGLDSLRAAIDSARQQAKEEGNG